jgi:Heterokaryon incompatibility protein (HET)
MSSSFPFHSFYEPEADRSITTDVGIELRTSTSAFPTLSTTQQEFYKPSFANSSNISDERQSSSASPDALYASIPLSTTTQSIRVLDLHASANPHDESLSAHLRVVHLAAKPAYTALSYAWSTLGVQGHRYIKCNEHYRVKITNNCHSALWHLRNSLGPVTIWVDAICIDQSGDGEKENQIPLMGDVYSLARTVYVWLGPGDGQSALAMGYLREVGFQENFDYDVDGAVGRVGRRLPLKYTWRLVLLGYNYSGSWFWRSGMVVPVLYLNSVDISGVADIVLSHIRVQLTSRSTRAKPLHVNNGSHTQVLSSGYRGSPEHIFQRMVQPSLDVARDSPYSKSRSLLRHATSPLEYIHVQHLLH